MQTEPNHPKGMEASSWAYANKLEYAQEGPTNSWLGHTIFEQTRWRSRKSPTKKLSSFRAERVLYKHADSPPEYKVQRGMWLCWAAQSM